MTLLAATLWVLGAVDQVDAGVARVELELGLRSSTAWVRSAALPDGTRESDLVCLRLDDGPRPSLDVAEPFELPRELAGAGWWLVSVTVAPHNPNDEDGEKRCLIPSSTRSSATKRS